MAEEFHESEVVFSDQDDHHLNAVDECFWYRENNTMARVSTGHNKSKNKKRSNPMPVNIPDSIYRCGNRDVLGEDEEFEESDEMTPPHLIVGRRIAGKMAFSVCTGNGRTLKGRDLSEVRNSILRMTGFLET